MLPAYFSALDEGLSLGPAGLVCRARDVLSRRVRECRHVVTFTACQASDVLHLPQRAHFLQSVCFAWNPDRIRPANALAK